MHACLLVVRRNASWLVLLHQRWQHVSNIDIVSALLMEYMVKLYLESCGIRKIGRRREIFGPEHDESQLRDIITLCFLLQLTCG